MGVGLVNGAPEESSLVPGMYGFKGSWTMDIEETTKEDITIEQDTAGDS